MSIAIERIIAHNIMIYAEHRQPDRMNQFRVEEIIREELATLRAKAEAYDKQQKSVAEYDQEMEANAKQVAEWKRKAEAYDKGVETILAEDKTGNRVSTAIHPENYSGINIASHEGYTCRKVKVCEVVG